MNEMDTGYKLLMTTLWGIPDQGGVWAYMDTVRTELKKRGHKVQFVANEFGGKRYYLTEPERLIPKHVFYDMLESKLVPPFFMNRQTDFWLHYAEMNRYGLELAAAYGLQDDFHLIHAQDAISAYALWRVKRRKAPMVLTVHGTLPKEIYLHLNHLDPTLTEEAYRNGPIYRYYRAMEQKAAAAADRIMVPKAWIRDYYQENYGTAAEKFVVCPHGFDIQAFRNRSVEISTDISPPQDKKLILCTARLVRIKGIPILLHALSILKQQRSDWVCWIAGDGESREELLRLRSELGLEQEVQFIGQRKDVPYLLTKADLFVLPSLQDNQPYSVMEAQVSGVPVIVSDAGGLPEMVQHGKTGLVFPSGNVEFLYWYIRNLLDSGEARDEMGRNAMQWGESQFSIEAMMERILNVYWTVLAARR